MSRYRSADNNTSRRFLATFDTLRAYAEILHSHLNQLVTLF